ncbi:protein FAR1-RELATED SEQUENCE 1-like, partial [Phalaenopsis equestris]|uniref:protein FAR1-RELATED SEQUENCE 1-like n=1 Tax=Phalaenopsis equestris TaxID=78828 RepID=UPI0009E297A1
MFEEEFIHGSCGLELHASIDDETEFFVKSLDDHKTNSIWAVHFDSFTMNIQCSCRKFEMMGVLCAHSLRVLNFLHIKKIPDKYLLLRWSENAKRDVYNSSRYMHLQQSQSSNNIQGDLLFEAHMQKVAYQCTRKAKGNSEAEQRMKESMKKLSLDIDDILVGKGTQLGRQQRKNKAPVNNESNMNDPAKMRPKGISNARLKGYWEKNKRSKGYDKKYNEIQLFFEKFVLLE